MLDYDLLEELMNHTFSDCDDDPTFMAATDASTTNSSSNDGLSEDYYQSPAKSKNNVSLSLQETLPLSANESNRQELSNESTFVSTVDDTEESAFATTDGESSVIPNVSDHTKPEGNKSNGKVKEEMSTQPNDQPVVRVKNGKEALNVPIDPVDAMMSDLLEKENAGKIHFKKGKNHNRKKRNFSLTSSQENIDRQNNQGKQSRSQEALHRL